MAGRLEWPPEWIGLHTWLRTDLVQSLRHEATGDLVFIAGGVLTDGTNLIGVCWPGGQHVATAGPRTGWSIEERVDPNAPKYMRRIWRQVVKSMVQAKRDAEAELGKAPA